ncbi:MAG: helix-turn-helix transcriptional regulator [Pseudomonadota bacterium]
MDALTHDQIWAAIDALAAKTKLSASGLAKKSGLDPTTFNRSKRFTATGRERWPSTESIAKILKSTNTSVDTFMMLIGSSESSAKSKSFNYREAYNRQSIPVIGFAQAGVGGFFDDGGFPVGQGWEEVNNPIRAGDTSYALRVSGDSMLPLYRNGDVIIVDPSVQVRKGDRVVAKTLDGEVFAKVLSRKTASLIEFQSLNPDHPDLRFSPDNLDWIARIIWASQ